MKKFKIIICCLLIFAFITSVVTFKKKKESFYLALGDYVSNDQMIDDIKVSSFSNDVGAYLKENKLVDDVSRGYLKNNMTSKKLLEMIESDVYGVDKINLSEVIKNSKYMTITLGINDVIGNIKYDKLNDNLIYNKDVIKGKVDVFKHNYHKIIEEIKDINNSIEVVLIGSYYIYNDDYVVDLINDSIKGVADYYNLSYVDLSDLKDKYLYSDNGLYLNELGQEEVSNKVILKIKEIV